MRLRFLRKEDNKWVKETPDDVSRWLWQHDGQEAVAVDDENSVYYCSLPSMMDSYREAWERERKVNDKRKAAMFIDLDQLLFSAET